MESRSPSTASATPAGPSRRERTKRPARNGFRICESPLVSLDSGMRSPPAPNSSRATAAGRRGRHPRAVLAAPSRALEPPRRLAGARRDLRAARARVREHVIFSPLAFVGIGSSAGLADQFPRRFPRSPSERSFATGRRRVRTSIRQGARPTASTSLRPVRPQLVRRPASLVALPSSRDRPCPSTSGQDVRVGATDDSILDAAIIGIETSRTLQMITAGVRRR